MGRFFVLKAVYEVHRENPSIDYIEKKLVIDQINQYPDDDKKILRMVWNPHSLDNLILKLEEFGLLKSYNIWEKPPKKMLKITNLGKKIIKSATRIFEFHNLPKKK